MLFRAFDLHIQTFISRIHILIHSYYIHISFTSYYTTQLLELCCKPHHTFTTRKSKPSKMKNNQ